MFFLEVSVVFRVTVTVRVLFAFQTEGRYRFIISFPLVPDRIKITSGLQQM
jgi:hypothetical protein